MYLVKYTGIVSVLLITFVNQPLINCAAPVLVAGLRTLFTVGTTTMDVAQFAADVDEFITGKQNNQNEDTQMIIKATELLIAASTTKVLNTILLQSKLEKIDDAVQAIHSSLTDLKKMIKSTDQQTFDIYKNDFERSFLEHDLIKHIRFLPEILTYRVPGAGSELLTEIIQKTRCNMTALEEFTEFYLNLLSDGIALQMLYYKFTTDLTFEQVLIDEWKDPIEKVRQSLEGLIVSCAKNFLTNAQEDVENAVNIDDLVRSNEQRYIFKWSDVIFYASMGTEQFHYMKYRTGRLFRHNNDDNNKVAVFGRKGEPSAWDAADIERKLKSASFDVPSETDETAAKDVLEQIEEYITSLGESIGVILVFFDGEDFETTGIQPDTDSPVVKYSLEGVTLEYCFSSGLVCGWRDKITSHKQSTGKFRVYIYPNESGDVDEFATDGAATPYKLLSSLLAFALCFFWMI